LHSKDILTPETITSLYESEDSIRRIIDNKYNSSETFAAQFEQGFRVIPPYERVNAIFTTKYHKPGSVVQVLDI
jgi:hypothetical protein